MREEGSEREYSPFLGTGEWKHFERVQRRLLSHRCKGGEKNFEGQKRREPIFHRGDLQKNVP